MSPPERPADPKLRGDFSLDRAKFAYEVEPKRFARGVAEALLRYPSPVETKYPENNTVHAEWFRPFGPGPFPCVIVLHIAGGDFDLSRFISRMLASQGISTVFVKMPFYGERRPQGKRINFLSGDPDTGFLWARQTILDLRRTCDWIEANPELDGKRIGVMGVSLGAIMGALGAAIEPRMSHACLIMGGAEIQHIMFESVEREAREAKARWVAAGGTRESFAKLVEPFDPATYADRLKERVVLMVGASEDQTIPRQSGLALWEATGRQPIIWYPCGHYTMARYLVPALGNSVQFFQKWPTKEENRKINAAASSSGAQNSK